MHTVLPNFPGERPVHDDVGVLRSEDVRAMCHDCRSPLTIITAYASFLRADLDPAEAADEIEMLAAIPQRAAEISELLEDFQFLEEFGDRDPHLAATATPLATILSQVRHDLEESPAWRGIAHRIDQGCVEASARCDAGALVRALKALMAHIRRASGGEGGVVLKAELCPGGQELRLLVGKDAEISRAPHLPADADVEPADETKFNFRLRFARRVAERAGARLIVPRSGERSLLWLSVPADGALPHNPLGPQSETSR